MTSATPSPGGAGRAQAKRRPPRLAEVVRTEPLSPGMLRIVLGGDGLTGFEPGPFTDAYVKLQFPPAGARYAAPFDNEAIRAELPREQWPRVRTYTVAAWDATLGELTIEVVVHGDRGVAGPWALGARPGDRIQLQGPGGAYAPDPEAGWHLLVGDESVLPAIAASLGRVPDGVPAFVVVEVDGPGEERALPSPGDLSLTWVHRGAGAGALLAAVAGLRLPSGPGHCFVHGEAEAVRDLRRHLIAERGLDRAALSASGYWKRGRDDEGWRADKSEWNRLVEADLGSVAPGDAGSSGLRAGGSAGSVAG